VEKRKLRSPARMSRKVLGVDVVGTEIIDDDGSLEVIHWELPIRNHHGK